MDKKCAFSLELNDPLREKGWFTRAGVLKMLNNFNWL
jgi:hypothetical protein